MNITGLIADVLDKYKVKSSDDQKLMEKLSLIALDYGDYLTTFTREERLAEKHQAVKEALEKAKIRLYSLNEAPNPYVKEILDIIDQLLKEYEDYK